MTTTLRLILDGLRTKLRTLWSSAEARYELGWMAMAVLAMVIIVVVVLASR